MIFTNNPLHIGSYHKRTPYTYCLIDGLIIFFSLFLATLVFHPQNWLDFWPVAVIAVIFFYTFSALTGLYSYWGSGRILRKSLLLWSSWALSFSQILMMGFATKTTDNYSRLVFITWACLSPIAMNVALVYFSKKPLIKEPITHRRVRAVIAGWSPSCVDVTNLINRSPGLDMNILGYFDFDAQHENNNQNLRFLGSFDDLINDARDGSYHLVYLNLQSEHMHMVTELTRELANSTVSVYWMIPDDLTEVTLAPRVHDFGERHAISLHEIPFTQWQVKLKRIEDVVLSSIILILIAVPMAIIALLIKILALRCFMWTEGGKIPA